MGNLFRGSCCNDDDILWFLILFLLLFWNGCGCNSNGRSSNNGSCGCNSNNSLNDCGC